MRVAMLVHNAVVHDARVIKSATTLKEAGVDVEIHGISKSKVPESIRLAPSGIPVLLGVPLAEHGTLPAAEADSRIALGSLDFAVIALLAATITLVAWLFGVTQQLLPSSPGAWAGLAFVFAASLSCTYALWRVARPYLALRQHYLNRAIFWLHANYRRLPILAVAFGGAILYAAAADWLLTSALWPPTVTLAGLATVPLAGLLFVWFQPDALRDFSRWLCVSLFASRLGRIALTITYKQIANALIASVSSRPVPDIVHIHDAAGLLAVETLKAKYDCPIIWDAHEIYEDMATLEASRAEVVRKIIKGAEENIDGFITINESIADFYAQNYPALPPATVVMNATAKCEPRVYDGRLHQAAGLPLEEQIVLYQGGFGGKRGLHELVRAAAGFKPGWTLVMMGWGPIEQELKNLAASLSSPRGKVPIVFIPPAPQSELQDWTAGGAIGLIPYENTGLNHLYCTPNKLWEYPNAGVPILCSDLVEMAKMIKRYGAGRLIPRDFTAADIEEAVNRLTEEDLAEMRANCAQFVKTNNWSHYEPRILKLYDSLGGARQVPAPDPRLDVVTTLGDQLRGGAGITTTTLRTNSLGQIRTA